MELTNSTPTPEPETETPALIKPLSKPLNFSNGLLKRHAPLHLHHHHPVVVTYRECLKNHAAVIGGHAMDGCGEFMTSPATNPNEPTSLKCAACGCHRNFHRQEPEEPPPLQPLALEYQPHHRHHPPPPTGSPNNSPSPPPISSSYYPSAPHMLLSLSHGLSAPLQDGSTPLSGAVNASATPISLSPNGRKRFRTKFTPDQKGKMLEFAERVGWKMQKIDEDLITEFCTEIGVEKGVFKVWMHNNKNTFGRKELHGHQFTNNAAVSTPETTANNGNDYGSSGDAATATTVHHHQYHEINNDHQNNNGYSAHVVGANGSSSC